MFIHRISRLRFLPLPFLQRIIQFLLQTSEFIVQIICDLYGRDHCVADIPKWSDIDKNKHPAYVAFMCRLEFTGNLITHKSW